ncbi:hypothetical protein [Methanococcus maripaludis]|uniref:hypothetical protein n=1 Tax=Methanococcus maripaludis TaxID=39152 RepID=UPI001B80652F|nr:hypothetical protein [Methanococcus maripaludis]
MLKKKISLFMGPNPEENRRELCKDILESLQDLLNFEYSRIKNQDPNYLEYLKSI